MKKLFTIALLATGLMTGLSANAQKDEDKSKRPSPPATITQKISSGAIITIDYSQPSVAGRSIGKNLEPMPGKIWRTGANEATVFQTDKDLTIMGKTLPAGKYAMFTIFDDNIVTVIFNKKHDQWGAYEYKEAEDQLRIQTKVTRNANFSEKMTFDVSSDGKVSLYWGGKKFHFAVS
jgi:hypothetical protein